MSNYQYKIAVVGPTDVTSIFRSTGATIFEADTGESALAILKDIKKQTQNPEGSQDRYAIVVILERLVAEIRPEDYEKVAFGSLPAIIAVPGFEGSSGVSMEKLARLAEKAVGSNILN